MDFDQLVYLILSIFGEKISIFSLCSKNSVTGKVTGTDAILFPFFTICPAYQIACMFI